MVATVGSLQVLLSADTNNFTRALTAAGVDVLSLESKSNRAFASMERNATSRLGVISRNVNQLGMVAKAGFGGIASGAIAAVAPILTLSTALNTAKKAMDEFGDLADVAQRLGVNVERLQELRFAAEQSGMAIANFDVAFRRFIRRSAEAAQGGGAAVTAFKELNVQLRDGEGRMKESDRLLGDVADALTKVENPADKLRIAFKLFDTDGAAMVNVLAKGSAGLDEFAQKARDLGIIVDRHLINSVADLSEQYDTATRVIDVKFKQAMVSLAPAIVFAADVVARMADDVRDLVDAFSLLENKSSAALDTQMRTLGLQRLDIENKILAVKQEQRELTDTARDLGFGEESAVTAAELKKLEDQLARIGEQEQRILEIQEARRTTVLPQVEISDPAKQAADFIAKYMDELKKSAAEREHAAVSARIYNDAIKEGVEISREEADELARLTISRDEAERAAKRDTGTARERTSAYQQAVQRIRETTDALIAEQAATMGLIPGTVEYTFALNQARTSHDLLTAAQASGLQITPALRAEVERLATAYAHASGASRDAATDTKQANTDLAETGNVITDIGNALAGIFAKPIESLWDFVDEVMKPVAVLDRKHVDACVQAAF